MNAPSASERRSIARRYHALLPEFFPIKLDRAAIGVDFVVSNRHDSSDEGPALDARVTPRRMLAWLRSMPSYRAGVPVRIGQEAGAGLAFDKGAELVDLLDPARPATWVARQPLAPEERAFLATPRAHLLVELHLAPRAAAPDAREAIRAAAGLDPRALHWMVGPLAPGDEAEAARVVAALPAGSRLTLRPAEGAPLPAAALSRLEAAAHAHGHTVTDWTCRGAQARVGLGFFDVDRLTGQADLARRAHDLITCASCPSRTQCHSPVDEPALAARLDRELRVLGLTPAAAPQRLGPRSLRLEVTEPVAAGDEAYLSHALGQPVAVALAHRGAGGRPAAAFAGVAPTVLRRWYATGFLPVTELNSAAERVLEDLTRRRAARSLAG